MATVSTSDLVRARQGCAVEIANINYTKPQINAAVQAVEDWFETNRISLAAAIDTATGPFTFTAAQKKRIVKFYLTIKLGLE